MAMLGKSLKNSKVFKFLRSLNYEIRKFIIIEINLNIEINIKNRKLYFLEVSCLNFGYLIRIFYQILSKLDITCTRFMQRLRCCQNNLDWFI